MGILENEIFGKDSNYGFYDLKTFVRTQSLIGGGPFTPEDNYIEGSYSVVPCIFPDIDGSCCMTFDGLWEDNLANIKIINGVQIIKNFKVQNLLYALKFLMEDNLLELAERSREIF